jgi:hypothetical protein
MNKDADGKFIDLYSNSVEDAAEFERYFNCDDDEEPIDYYEMQDGEEEEDSSDSDSVDDYDFCRCCFAVCVCPKPKR